MRAPNPDELYGWVLVIAILSFLALVINAIHRGHL